MTTAKSRRTFVSLALIGVFGRSKSYCLLVSHHSATLVACTGAALTCTGCARQEIDDLCEEWQPEPLHKPLPNSQALPEPPVISRCCCTFTTLWVPTPLCTDDALYAAWQMPWWHAVTMRCSASLPRRGEVTAYVRSWHVKAHMLCSAAGAWVVANGRRALNMVSPNFLGVAGDPGIMVRAQSCC